MEAPLPSGKCYRHAPERACLRVRVLALRRYKPASVPETWCDSLPVASDLDVARPSAVDRAVGLLFWGPLSLGSLFYAGCWLICLASTGYSPLFYDFLFPVSVVGVPVIIAIAVGRPRFSVLELDSKGIRLLGIRGSAPCFVPYASIRSVQTYLDQGAGGGTSRGVVLDVDGGRAVTLELGGSTAEVVSTICRHTHVVVLHSRCNWS